MPATFPQWFRKWRIDISSLVDDLLKMTLMEFKTAEFKAGDIAKALNA